MFIPFVSVPTTFNLDKHHLMAVGDQIGTLHVLEVPWPMRHPSSNEVGSSLYITYTLTVVHLSLLCSQHICQC